ITFMKVIPYFIIVLFSISPVFAQVPETLPPEYIKTIEFKDNTEFSGTPIIKLGQGLSLEFDDLIGDEADYYYKISYYNFDWTPTDLSKNEYMNGFDDVRIKTYKNSYNTLQIYTHYHLSIPNKQTKALTKSGNYMLEIYNDQDKLVFSKRFMVFEYLASVQARFKRSRDLNYINTKHVINISITEYTRIIFRIP